MNFRILIIALATFTYLQSCSTTKDAKTVNSVVWVSGFKTEASTGAGKTHVLNVHRGDDLENEKWENFYAPIEGFEFEQGVMQKIEVEEIHLDKSQTPADASSIKYTLVKVLDKQKDLRTELEGNWTLARLNDAPLNRMVVAPTMTIDLSSMMISGNSGCNTFSGKIKSLGAVKMELMPVRSTRKMCANKNVEADFNAAVNDIRTYHIKGNTVTFFNQDGEKVLMFIKDEKTAANPRLHDIWVAVRIDGSPIDRMSVAPRMEINLTEMRVMGNNGCNEYTGKIERVDALQLKFGPLASTKKMCPKMQTAHRFDAAIQKTASYRLEGLELTVLDAGGKEVLAFLKAD